ncbi:MAG: ABC transporter permease subunit [Clostridiales bacterium]|jgi:putative aldouronate transport system permease protein|nr:ABC transporter permease subunit [Clostridiales bacterium]
MKQSAGAPSASAIAKRAAYRGQVPYFLRARNDIRRNPSLYAMLLPVLAFYLLFCYKPMYGALIAFFDFTPGIPLFDNKFIGARNFLDFFANRTFSRVMRNTLTISLATIACGFPAPIALALLLNELRSRRYSRVVQTVSYMPHFISLVVICGMIRDFTGSHGVIVQALASLGLMEPVAMLSKSRMFLPIYVISDIWQGVGYGSIIYLAALTGIDQEQYEAATIDGAGRWKQLLHVTLPGIAPTVMTMLLLRLGRVMNVGFEKIILLYNAQTYEVADVISSYVYRVGLQQFDYSYSTAVGLFNSAINLIVLVLANAASKKTTGSGLW